MNIVSKARKTAITTIAALAVITAGATVAPTEAQAGNHFINGLVGGLIVGGIVAASRNNYNNGYYNNGYYNPAPVYSGCRFDWVTRYNSYGQPYNVQVKTCY